MRTTWAAVGWVSLGAGVWGGVAMGQELPEPPESPEVAWVRANAHGVRTAEPGTTPTPLDDLAVLKDLIGDARIVGLGESTHGTREHFQMKHRVLEYLASEMGFTIFSIEASAPESFAVDGFVTRGEGDAARLVGGMLFWTWNTEEVLAMVRWMRAFNAREGEAGSGKRVAFTGFDMQSPGLPLKILRETLGPDDPLAEDLERLRGLARSVSQGPMGGSAPFGAATGEFPARHAAGKRVRFSGWIRTADLTGRAALWWRADVAGGQVGAFDNMMDRAPTGTTAWREFAIELDVPAETVGINFGMILTGEGRAWFDDLRVEIDGQAWRGEGFDFAFDGPALTGFGAGLARNYEAVIDPGVGHGAPGSLRLASVGEGGGVTPAECEAAAARFLDDLKRDDERLANRGLTVEARAWLRFNANLVRQWAGMYGSPNGYAARDAAMAENVRWILGADPEAKIVLWAHNAHVSATPPNMGWHLRQWYGDDYVSVGFATARGSYTAIRRGEGLRSDNALQEPPAGSVEALLDEAAPANAVIDLRPARRDDGAGTRWVREARAFRFVGALAMEEQFGPSVLGDSFDLLVWTRETTAARQLPGARAPGVEP